MKIQELLDDIKNQDLVLPEFQREYVWSKDQAKKLVLSLSKNFPVGGLLFWKTDNPPELKNIKKLPDKIGTVQVLLDGQQRLTTLYLLINGKIPPFYRKDDIKNDPRDLYYNIETADFQYYQSSRMKGNSLWINVVECFNDYSINVFEIAKSGYDDSNKALEMAQLYNDNLNKVRNIKEILLPVQVVPSQAILGEAIDIFDLVNRQGTKLTDADLALTHVTGNWAKARRVLKKKIDDLSTKDFYFDLTFMTRSLTGIVCKRALFETIHDKPKEELEKGWKQLSKILDYLVGLLPSGAFINSTEDVNTTNAFVPIIVYLSLNKEKFPTKNSLNNAINWLYSAHTWARYTAQTSQRLEHDVTIVVREESPWDSLRSQIIDQRGRIEVTATDFEGRVAQHPLYRMMFILAKAHGAIDWFNGMPLGTTYGNHYYIHSHHIFPQKLLYNELYDPDSHLDRKKVNEIANRSFLTATSNLSLSHSYPEEYLPEIDEKYPGALASQFIPMEPELWKISKYEEFLAARREMMASKLNEFMNSLISEPEVVHERPISELIEIGESINLEFKSSLQWDVIKSERNKELRNATLKTINALLNTEGGTLLIGVEDDGTICGIKNDLKLVKKSKDKFLQLITSLISENIGAQFAYLAKTRYEKLDGNEICVIDIDRSPEPIFLKGPKGKEFYVRVGNTSRSLDPEQVVDYINLNWT